MNTSSPEPATVQAELTELRAAVNRLGKNTPEDKLSILLFSNDLDKVLTTFMIATGAAASGMKVNIFLTFWGMSALRDPRKTAKKTFIGKMFGWMLPRGVGKLKISKMNMGGMGTVMIKQIMKQQNVASLPEMIKTAGELGVKLHACMTSMDLMGIKREELIDYPGMQICGVSSFVEMAATSKVTLFV